MDQIEERDLKYLRQLRDLAHATANIFKLYFEKLETTGFSGSDPYLAEKIQKHLDSIINDNKLSQKIVSVKDLTFKKAFALFSAYHEYRVSIHEVMHVVKANELDLSKEGTYTSSGTTLTTSYLEALMEIHGNAMETYQKWHTEIDKPDLHELLIKYLPKVTALKQVEEITDLYLEWVGDQRGDRVIDLYSALLQYVIDTHNGPGGDREINKYVVKTLEKLKTQVLEMPRVAGIQNRTANTIQRLVQCYNLIPDAPSRPLTELIKELGVEAPGGKDLSKLLNQVAKLLSKPDRKFGFIAWHKLIRSPMEHNMWGLMDMNYIRDHKLEQSSEFGVNKKSMERTQTLRPLPLDPNAEDMLIVCNKEFTPKSENFYYVIESLNGTDYRFMIPWHINPNQKILHIPEAWIENLSNLQNTPSRRLENYNAVLNGAILAKLQKPFVAGTVKDEMRKDELYWKNMRLRLKRKAGELLKKIFEGVDNPKYEQIARHSFYEDLILEITDQIQVENLRTLPTGAIRQQLDGELLLSYNRELDKLRRNLSRDIDNLYKKNYQKKLGASPTKNKLIEAMDAILDEVLETYINRRNNIYLTIEAKFAVLDKTLLKMSA